MSTEFDNDMAGMSDEDFLNSNFVEQDEPQITEEAEPDIPTGSEDTETDVNVDGEEQVEDEPQGGEDDTPAEDPDTEQSTENKETDTDTDTAGETDFEAEYKRLMAPFKANGTEITPRSSEDAIRLMQMGANYNKKMAALKPTLKMVKMLENNGLLDEAKLSYLIDLDKKDPSAIGKLVKDSGYDPLDTDPDSEAEYTPKTYTVDDKELALDAVLEEIQDTATYAKTIDVVSNKWDEASKQVLVENPEVIRAINSHMENGIYDTIQQEIERLNTFGHLPVGISNIEAYRMVGDRLNAEGKFGGAPAPANAPQQDPAPQPARKQQDAKLKSKKRAASSTKAKAPAKAKADFNPLAMSDEEFEKTLMTEYV